MATRATVSSFLGKELRLRSLALYALVFLSCFISAKFGQYLLYDQHTSPALIWPPFGIALAAVLLGGNRMWLPIALAELLAAYSFGSLSLPTMLAATIGQTIQPLAGAWVMRKFGFNGHLPHIRDAFILIVVAFAATMIAPAISTFAEVATHTLPASIEVTWTRAWAGGILSVLILTPLISLWLPFRKLRVTRMEIAETITALSALVLTTMFLSWTAYGASYGLTGIYVLLAILTWIALRMEPRILSVALLILTILGMGGSFYLRSATPLNQQLFSQELFIELIAVIFLVFAALVEERRRARLAIEQNVEQLRRAIARIEREDAAKNQFIATLAHELRNPLAPVVSALDLLSLQRPSKEALQTIEGAQRELAVMRRLLDDILDVARISQTRFKLQKEVLDIRPLIERSVESTRIFLRNRKHTLTVTLPAEPVVLEVDPVRFQQIIVNLLNNAGKYTKSGGKIELICERSGGQAVIRVCDNGIGIPQEFLGELFEPFRQIQPSYQIGTGLGIGLWLTKQLVEAHAGMIEAASAGPELGSCFTMRFPLRDEVLPEKAGVVKASKALVPSVRILIVDDNEAAAQAMQKLLKLKGHDAKVAHDGASALSAIEEYLPHVVLLDIGLPDTSGYDVARTLRGKKLKLTLIALTGYGGNEDKEKAKEAGFDFHLVKPVGIADIESILIKTTH